MPLPTVAQYMVTAPFALSPDLGILEAVEFFLKHKVSGAPVVVGDRLVGVLSSKDCLRLLTEGVRGDVPRGTVAEFMNPSEVVVTPAMDIYFVAGLFLSHPYRRLPVVVGERLVGQIGRLDILRAIKAIYKVEIDS